MLRDRALVVAVASLVALAVVVGLAGCASSSDSPGGSSGGATNGSSQQGGLAPSSDPTLDEGRALVEAKCDMCHTLDRIEQASKDAQGWDTTVERMRGKGAVLTDEEAQKIVDYLASR